MCPITHFGVAIQDLQQTVAGLRNGLSGMQALLDQDDWHTYLRAMLQEPLQQFKHVQTASNAFAEVSSMGLPDRLVRQGSTAASKGKQAQVHNSCYSSAVSAQLCIAALAQTVLMTAIAQTYQGLTPQ